MAGDSENDVLEPLTSKDTETNTANKKKGVMFRVLDRLFRARGDDFEKRLQHLSKEEAAVLARIRRRSHNWRRITRHLIIFSVFFEVIAVGYAIMTTRSIDLNWKMRALRVLPMFVLPALCFVTHSATRSFSRICEQKDQRTLEKLRAERQAKIDELKEKTNYYTTQQLIQRYDSDPAAKAAAATVLASKLGADSGLQVYFGDESQLNAPTGKSSDVEVARSGELRNRMHHPEVGLLNYAGFDGAEMTQQDQLVVEHHPQTRFSEKDGGWIARLAAMLVGEDPTQSYPLICENCHMHNGLARKEEFSYITYYCPHCKALNGPKQPDVSGSDSLNATSSLTLEEAEVLPSAGGPTSDTVHVNNGSEAASASVISDS